MNNLVQVARINQLEPVKVKVRMILNTTTGNQRCLVRVSIGPHFVEATADNLNTALEEAAGRLYAIITCPCL